MKKLLIVGAYGLVGQHICSLLERDYPNIELTKIKYNEAATLHEYDYFIFAAGYGQPAQFSKDKFATIYTHTELFNTYMQIVKPGGTVLYVSSSEIYSGAPSPHTEEMIGTTTPQHPRACYIEGKRCGEAIAMAYKELGYDVKIARLALSYGPGTKKSDTRVLNQFIEQALTTGEIRMKDAGEAYRTYLYVQDAARMMVDVLFKGTDTVYNIGGISRVNIKELAGMIARLTGAKVIPGESTLIGAPDDVELDITKVTTEFPQTLTDLENGLLRTINYQKELYGK